MVSMLIYFDKNVFDFFSRLDVLIFVLFDFYMVIKVKYVGCVDMMDKIVVVICLIMDIYLDVVLVVIYFFW